MKLRLLSSHSLIKSTSLKKFRCYPKYQSLALLNLPLFKSALLLRMFLKGSVVLKKLSRKRRGFIIMSLVLPRILKALLTLRCPRWRRSLLMTILLKRAYFMIKICTRLGAEPINVKFIEESGKLFSLSVW